MSFGVIPAILGAALGTGLSVAGQQLKKRKQEELWQDFGRRQAIKRREALALAAESRERHTAENVEADRDTRVEEALARTEENLPDYASGDYTYGTARSREQGAEQLGDVLERTKGQIKGRAEARAYGDVFKDLGYGRARDAGQFRQWGDQTAGQRQLLSYALERASREFDPLGFLGQGISLASGIGLAGAGSGVAANIGQEALNQLLASIPQMAVSAPSLVRGGGSQVPYMVGHRRGGLGDLLSSPAYGGLYGPSY
jgi:hypothetical protein